MTLVTRYDRAQMRGDRVRLSTGAIRMTGELTKSGVFEYQDSAGRKFREWRPPEEVAKADSLATIDDLPVTIGHPRMGVHADTFGKLAVGHTRAPQVTTLGDGNVVVRGTTIIARKDAVEGVEGGKLVDTSMGYACRIDETAGVTPQGERYDRIQRDIMYNHEAVLPPGQARLGTRLDSNDFGLRLDAAGNQIADDDTSTEITPMKVKIRKDGKDHEVEAGSQEHISALEAERDAAIARADANDGELTKFREDSAKAARAELEGQAGKILGKDFKADGLTDRQIREKVIAKAMPKVKCDGKDDVYVGGLYEAALNTAPAAQTAPKRGSQALVNGFSLPAAVHTDAADDASDDDDDKDEPAFLKKAKDTRKKADSAWMRDDSKGSN